MTRKDIMDGGVGVSQLREYDEKEKRSKFHRRDIVAGMSVYSHGDN